MRARVKKKKMMMNMPAGVRFKPLEVELVVGYLEPKNCGQPLPWGHIPDTPLYMNNHHWDVVAEPDVQGGDDKMSTYIFTTLTKKEQLNLANKGSKGKKKKQVVEADDGAKRDQFIRTAGCGTWKSQNRKDVLDAQGNVVEFKRHLVYEINKKYSIQNTTSLGNHDHYTMNKFSLAGVGDFKYVLCVITKSFKKRMCNSSYSFDDQDSSCVDGDITRACKSARLDDHDRFVVAADCQDDVVVVVSSSVQSSITTEDDVGAVNTTSMVVVGCSSSSPCDGEEELQFVNECNPDELLMIVEVLCGNVQVDSVGAAAEYQPNSVHDPVVAADCKDDAVVEVVNNSAPQASISTEDDGDHEKECCDPWADYDSMELDVVNNCNPDELVMMVDEHYGNVQVELPPSVPVDFVGDAAQYQPANNDQEQLMSTMRSRTGICSNHDIKDNGIPQPVEGIQRHLIPSAAAVEEDYEFMLMLEQFNN